MSMIPAFSPGPCSTSLLRVGSFFRWRRELLYEQCSLHITLKMPSSVKVGSRPSNETILSYSDSLNWWEATTSGVMALISLHRHRGDHGPEYGQSVRTPHQGVRGPLR